MCNISTRLDVLNRQLIIISKLQKMEEQHSGCPRAICKKRNIYNNFGRCCNCVHQILSLKEQCNGLNCTEECALYDNNKRISCNSGTCKTRKKLHLCKNVPLIEAQVPLKDDANIKNDTINKELQEPEKQSKSDQVNLTSQFYKMYTEDKTIDTYEEKNEQTIPTRDNFRVELGIDSSNMSYMQQDAAEQEKSQIEINKNVTNELQETMEDICTKDKKIFERIQKDLLNEKKHTKELEKKLKSLTCSLNCLKEDSEQRAACLNSTLGTAEEQAKDATDSVIQLKDQANSIKTDRDELSNEIAKLQQQITEVACKNTDLLRERNELKTKLQVLSEDESKRCEEVEKEVNRMKHAVKEKENALNKERAEFIDMILELTNVINIQKRRICEVTGICNNQQHSMQEKDKELSEKNIELSKMKNKLQSSNSTFKEMEEKIQHLEYCLCEEKKACNCLNEELKTHKENHSSELRIKEKIIEEQNKTISKQRKLLHDSEEMVQQVASEFDQLKDELQQEKQKNESLQITLDETSSKLSKVYLSQCEQCRILTGEIAYLKKEKQKAITVAKFAYQKLYQSIREYKKRLTCEREQHKYMALIIERKEHEIGCLKSQMCQNNMRII